MPIQLTMPGMVRFCLLNAVLLPVLAMAQIALPVCGGENQAACGPADQEYYSNNPGTGSPCDFGLVQSGAVSGVGGTCINGAANNLQPRWTQPFNTSWTGWALAQQRYGIGGDALTNLITTVGTHNSAINLDSGFSNPDRQNQVVSIADQLQLGARYIQLEERFYQGQMRICHGSNSECSVLNSSISSGRLFANAVSELAGWLIQNPSEVVILDLSGDPQGQTTLVMQPILADIGAGKIVTTADADCATAGQVCRFPSLNTIRGQGKQVVILSSNFTDPDYTFPRSELDEEDPFNPTLTTQAFPRCLDGSGHSTSTHATDVWPYTSEDRSGGVLSFSPSGFLGFLDEAEVQQATSCGYAIVALDYLNHRSYTYPEDPSLYSLDGLSAFPPEVTTDTPDNRLASSIWSFDVNDLGTDGYSFLKANGRWSTAAAGTVMSYACSAIAPTNGNPLWLVTTETGAFSNGAAACQSEGSARYGFPFQFSHPVNSVQNSAVVAAANGGTVWVNYQVQAVPNFSVAPLAVAATTTPGGAVPAAQQILVGGPPNARVNITASAIGPNGNLNWLALPVPADFTLDSTGQATVSIGYSSVASTRFGTGTFSAIVTFELAGNNTVTSVTSATINVGLTVKTTPVLGPECQSGTASDTSIFFCPVAVSDPSNNAATFSAPATLNQISTDANGLTVVTTIQSRPVNALSSANQEADFAFYPPVDNAYGNVGLVATYPGDSVYNSSISPIVTLNVESGFNPDPTSEVVSFPVGQPSQVTGLYTVNYTENGSASSSVSCSINPCWLQGNLSLNNTVAATLAPGIYAGNLAIAGSDATFNVPITLSVTTSFSPMKRVDLLAAQFPVAGYLPVGLTAGSSIPITATSDQPWLTVNVGGTAPTNIGLVANPSGLAANDYVGNVTVSSTLASTVQVAIGLKVVPLTTITTVPPGLPVIVDSVTYTSPQTFLLDPTQSHTLGTVATTALNGTQYSFQGWSDHGPLSHSIRAPESSSDTATWTATFTTTGYTVTVSASPANAGTVTLSPPSSNGYYASGTSVTATAAPAANYLFGNFSGDLTGSTNPLMFQVTGPVVATGIFVSAAPANLAAQSGTPQSAAVGTGFTVPLSAQVTNVANTPVPGVLVSFIGASSGASAVLSSAGALTNSNGIASVNARANNATGTYTVTASVGSLNTLFTLTNTPLSCNVIQDAQVGVADVQSLVNQALGIATPSNDLTGDGVVNVLDVQVMTNAVLNEGCIG